ncbi:MAG: trigger factor [Prevotellaceae bacterium]|jgi:trigger factor|nr:trigger factor [Prevotellaceae bacterium]
MNITRKDIDANNAVLTVNIEKNDYSTQVEKRLREYRKRANVPGFRPGMAPAGLLKKMYGKAILDEQISELVGEALDNYIKENDINIFGSPFMSENQVEINYDTQDDFELSFNIAIAPEVEVSYSDSDTLPHYTIEVEDEAVDEAITMYTKHFAVRSKVDTFSPDDMLKGDMMELDADGKALEDTGIQIEDVVFMPKYEMKGNEDALKLFEGKKVGETVVFNPKRDIGNEKNIASLLKISNEREKTLTSDFRFVIKEITHSTDAEINQELFDTVFGKGTVKSENEFREKIREKIAAEYQNYSAYRLEADVRNFLLQKNRNLTFPESVLKDRIKAQNKDFSDVDVENEYSKLIEPLTWQLIMNKIVIENKIELYDEEIQDEARKASREQFAQYGIHDLDPEALENHVQSMLKNTDYVRSLTRNILEKKVIAVVSSQITLNNTKITLKEFDNLFKK